MNRRLFACVLTVLVAQSVGCAAEDALVLVDGANAPCPIVTQANPPHHEWVAATMLADYLTQMSGAKFTAQKVEKPPEGRAILVGSFGSDMAKDLPGDSFVIRAENGRLQIAGPTPLGTAYGVFAFLQDDLGCRWWSRNEEDVPRMPAIRVKSIDRTVKAVFRLTDLYNREAQTAENGFLYKSRGEHTEDFTSGHSLYPLLTPYATQHPEIYPYNKKTDKRAANDLHFCYLATGIAEALADALSKEVDARKGEVRYPIYFAGMGDWYGGMCECEQCKAAYEEETWTDPDGKKHPGYSGTLLRMINRTAEILDKKYPGIRVGTFAYMSLEAPPGKTVPRENVVIRIPHLRHCIIHGANKCPKNRAYYLDLERWLQIAPGRVYIWDYGVNFGENFFYPFPVLTSMADNIHLAAQMGVAGEMIQGNYVSTGSDMCVLKNYVWGKLMWNPSLETADVVKEFCDGYYGPAGKDIRDYVMLMEEAAQKSDVHLDEFAKLASMKKVYLTDEMSKLLREKMDHALAAALGKEPYERRVREAMVSLDAVDLWHAGPLVEQDGRLVRADMGNQYTYPRALALVEHCRNGSPREWGSGQSYRHELLTLHGGPLPTLSRGEVQVKVAPVLRGRIYQIVFRGENLLGVGAAGEAGYPNVGGSWEQLQPGPRMGTMVGEPAERSVEAELPCGVPLWGVGPQMVARKTVQLLDDGTIKVTGWTLPKPPCKDVSASEVTEYAVGKGAGVQVEVLLAGDKWQAATFELPPAAQEAAKGKKAPEPVPQASIPADAKALRIRLPGKRCVVEDRYLAPAVKGGKLLLDARAGTLITTVEMAGMEIDPKGENKWLVREIRLQPLETPAPQVTAPAAAEPAKPGAAEPVKGP